jgi:hypothetical protein
MFASVSLLHNPAKAYDNGIEDLDTACSDCHVYEGQGAITIGLYSDTVETNQTGIDINVTVTVDRINSEGKILGVMLLSEDYGNIKNTGWEITTDPNDNKNPYNYNEKSVPKGDATFTWIMKAPAVVDEYVIYARVLYGDNEANYLESNNISVSVVQPQLSANGENDGTDAGFGEMDMKALSIGVVVGFSSVITVVILRRRSYE